MNSIINRYILKEISSLLVMILFTLTFVLLLGKLLQLMDLFINKGIGFLSLGKLFLYLLPSFLVFTLPISLLTAVLIGLGRLSADNEIIVLKATGFSLYQLLVPVALLSSLIFILTLITGLLMPYGNRATRDFLYATATQMASIGIKEKTFNADFKGLTIYANHVPSHGRYLEGVLISDQRSLKERGTFLAERAYLMTDPKTQTLYLRLETGSLHIVDPKLQYYRMMTFSSYDVQLDLGSSLAKPHETGRLSLPELSVTELWQRFKQENPGSKLSREIAIELNKKLSIPFSCLVFGLLGVPLGLRPHRSVKSRGLTIGLLIVLGYYILQLAGDALVEMGHIPPSVGVWSPNALFGLLGAGLFALAAAEKTPALPSLPGPALLTKPLERFWK